MKGFEHDPLADIAALQSLLHDQYDTGVILKELIQNADDANATDLHVGWMHGWRGSNHPLLQGPGIVVLNNGEFTPTDARAIPNLRLGTKGADERAIGKFGLGMKSVFHLCEAFFYLASPNQPA